jgi:Polyketide cyclase / dehydrase and lipid transport
MRVHETAIVDTSADAAWGVIRDFSQLAEWHQAVKKVEEISNGPGDRVGCVRRFQLLDGTIMVERLLALSDLDRRYSYGLVESPVPVRDFVGTVQVTPITQTGQCLLSWTSTFDPVGGDGSGIADDVRQGVIFPGFRGLSNVCAGRAKA